MKRRNLWFAVASVLAMSTSLSLMSQGLTDGVKVTLPYSVTVGDVVLDPGEYEIRRASTATDQVLRIFSNDKMRYQTVVNTIPALGNDTPEKTKVVLHHIGNNYYFDKIWMEGKDYGYEFVLPDRVRALQRELAVSVDARYTETPSTSTGAGPANSAREQRELDRQRESESVARQDSQDRQVPTRDALVPSQAVNSEPQQTAALQRDQRDSVNPAGVDSRQDNNRTNFDRSNDPLPATASDWFAYVLGGGLLLSMAALLRMSRTQA